jgi:hypothetical protein
LDKRPALISVSMIPIVTDGSLLSKAMLDERGIAFNRRRSMFSRICRMTTKTAVIAGASGLIGRRIAEQLLAQGGWNVVGLGTPPARLSRNALDWRRPQ